MHSSDGSPPSPSRSHWSPGVPVPGPVLRCLWGAFRVSLGCHRATLGVPRGCLCGALRSAFRVPLGCHLGASGVHPASQCSAGALLPTELDVAVRVVLYALIFVLSVGGNALVVAVLALNRRLRTVTNCFLLSLALSDLLLALCCMPFTLLPGLMGAFIFGDVVCKLVAYLMGRVGHGGGLSLPRGYGGTRQGASSLPWWYMGAQAGGSSLPRG